MSAGEDVPLDGTTQAVVEDSGNTERRTRSVRHRWIIAGVVLVLLGLLFAANQRSQTGGTRTFVVEDFTDKLATSEDGSVWLGTMRGLREFDDSGASRLYTSENSGLAARVVEALVVDRHGQVWAGTHEGLSALDKEGQWQTFTTSNSPIPGDWIDSLATDNDGNLWIATHSSSDGPALTRLDPGGNWTTYTEGAPQAGGYVPNSLAVDGEGRVWTAIQHRLYFLDGDGRWHSTPELPAGGVEVLAVDEGGRVWVNSAAGLSRREMDGRWTSYSSPIAPFPQTGANAIAFDQQGNAWISTIDGLHRLDRDGQWTHYTSSNSGLPADYTEAVAIDAHQRVWVLTLDLFASEGGTKLSLFEDETPRVARWAGTVNAALLAAAIATVVLAASPVGRIRSPAPNGGGVTHSARPDEKVTRRSFLDNRNWVRFCSVAYGAPVLALLVIAGAAAILWLLINLTARSVSDPTTEGDLISFMLLPVVLLPALSLAAGLAAISFICAIVALLSRWDWWLVAVVLSLAPPIIRLVQFFIVWFPPIPILDRMEAVIASPIVITVAALRWFFYARRRYIQREQAGNTAQ